MSLLERRPLCNNNPLSAPSINGKTFIICWRCCGAVVGIFVAMITRKLGASLGFNQSVILLLVLPATLDYVMNRLGLKKQNNKIRFLTGILLGYAIGLIEIFIFCINRY